LFGQQSTTGATGTVTFASSFSSTPRVFTSILYNPSLQNANLVLVSNITTTSFDYRFHNVMSSFGSTAGPFNWIAIN
jgi:hypothetical protein